MAQVEFDFSSDDIEHFDLMIQPAKNNDEKLHMIKNPEVFELDDAEEYVYLLRVVGNSGAAYKLTIAGAAQATSPLERKILPGNSRDSYLDKFTA